MFKDSYDRCFYKIGMAYLNGYKRGHFDLDILVKRISPKEVLSTLFAIFVKHKMLKPIEEMKESDKIIVWAEAMKIANGMNQKAQIKIVKSLLAIDKLGQLNP